jgi:hypothetical protein
MDNIYCSQLGLYSFIIIIIYYLVQSMSCCDQQTNIVREEVSLLHEGRLLSQLVVTLLQLIHLRFLLKFY